MKTVSVDHECCIGCGLCASLVPSVFRMDDGNRSVVHNPAGAPEKAIQEAVDGCPVSCIQWQE